MKKTTAFLLAFVLTFSQTAGLMAAQSLPQILADQSQYGVISITQLEQTTAKMKVMIEKDGQRYHYTLSQGQEMERFPLQMGDGQYKVSLLENIEGSRYRTLSSQVLEVDVEQENVAFLQSVQSIEWNASMKAIEKAAQLTAGMTKVEDKVKAIYQYVVANYTYDYDKIPSLTSDYLPDVEATFEAGKGICYDYSSLMAAMLRSVGVPTKLVKGYTPNAVGYHAWNEIYLNGKWIVVDATYDSQVKALGRAYTMAKNPEIYEVKYIY